MSNNVTVIEITNKVIKLFIGYILDGKVIISYRTEKNISSCIDNGEIINKEKIINILKDLKRIVIPEEKIVYLVQDVILILPPNGFDIFQNTKTTNVVSQSSFIEHIDISNLISLIRKENIGDSSKIVDIIPEVYTLDDGSTYIEAPFAKKSNSIELSAKVHILPKNIVTVHAGLLESAGIRVKRTVVSSYAATQAIASLKLCNDKYILIDVNDFTTNITLVGGNTPIATNYIKNGLENLIDIVATNFITNYDSAYNLLKIHGYKKCKLNFDPVIFNSKLNEGTPLLLTPKDLDILIHSYIEEYYKMLCVALDNMCNDFRSTRNLPIKFIGKFSEIDGINDELRSLFKDTNEIDFLYADVIYARGAKHFNCIGALLLSEKKHNIVIESKNKVTEIERENKNK